METATIVDNWFCENWREFSEDKPIEIWAKYLDGRWLVKTYTKRVKAIQFLKHIKLVNEKKD